MSEQHEHEPGSAVGGEDGGPSHTSFFFGLGWPAGPLSSLLGWPGWRHGGRPLWSERAKKRGEGARGLMAIKTEPSGAVTGQRWSAGANRSAAIPSLATTASEQDGTGSAVMEYIAPGKYIFCVGRAKTPADLLWIRHSQAPSIPPFESPPPLSFLLLSVSPQAGWQRRQAAVHVNRRLDGADDLEMPCLLASPTIEERARGCPHHDGGVQL